MVLTLFSVEWIWGSLRICWYVHISGVQFAGGIDITSSLNRRA